MQSTRVCPSCARSAREAICSACDALTLDPSSPDDLGVLALAMAERTRARRITTTLVAVLPALGVCWSLAGTLGIEIGTSRLAQQGLMLAAVCVAAAIGWAGALGWERFASADERRARGLIRGVGSDFRLDAARTQLPWPRLLSSAPVVLASLALALHAARLGARDATSLTRTLGAIPSLLAERPWTLLSYAFVHVSWEHVLANALALVAFGARLDLRVGRTRFVVLALAGAVGSALLHAAIGGRPDAPLVGASGAAYAVVGALLVVVPRTPASLGRAFGAQLVVPTWVWALFLMTVYTAVDVIARPEVAWAGHLGGFVSGALVGLWLRRVRPSPEGVAYEAVRAARLES